MGRFSISIITTKLSLNSLNNVTFLQHLNKNYKVMNITNKLNNITKKLNNITKKLMNIIIKYKYIITKYKYIITKYKYIIIIININYIFLILIDFLIDSKLSYYYLMKFSKILFIPKLINIISNIKINLASLVNYISNLENIFNTNINILLTSYDIYYCIPNIKNIIIFIVINLTFYFLVILYIIIQINSDSIFNSKLIRLTQINFIKIIYNIFIFILKIFSLYGILTLGNGYYFNIEANIFIAKQFLMNFD